MVASEDCCTWTFKYDAATRDVLVCVLPDHHTMTQPPTGSYACWMICRMQTAFQTLLEDDLLVKLQSRETN